MKRRSVLAAAAAALTLPGLRAQPGWPTRPIVLIVPFAPGGIADITARSVAEAMGRTLGQAIVIDNRPSAGGIVASTAVAKAAPDGYTLLLLSNANAVGPGLFRKLPFDVVHDFAPITTLGFFDLGVFAGAGSRFRSLREAVVHANANPGKLTIGSIAVGSTQHLAAELFKRMAGIDALVVPYKGTPAVLTALRTGEIDLAFEILGPMLPQLAGNAIGALAVTSQERYAGLPDVPTVIESGIADYVVASWNGLAAPAGTPLAVIERLNRAAREAIAAPEVERRLRGLGVRPRAGTPKELEALLAAEIRRWGEVIRGAGIKPE